MEWKRTQSSTGLEGFRGPKTHYFAFNLYTFSGGEPRPPTSYNPPSHLVILVTHVERGNSDLTWGPPRNPVASQVPPVHWSSFSVQRIHCVLSSLSLSLLVVNHIFVASSRRSCASIRRRGMLHPLVVKVVKYWLMIRKSGFK